MRQHEGADGERQSADPAPCLRGDRRRQGFEILERFHENGESAKTTDRSQLQALLKYRRTHKGKVHFVVVYNLTRFAREKYDHFALRAHLKSLGISLRSATEPIDDTSTGKLMEGVLAAFAQFDNDVRSDRTRAGMRAALELGHWTFPAPLGYLNAPKWSIGILLTSGNCAWPKRTFARPEQPPRVSAIQQKQDNYESLLYSEAIDVTTYGRECDKLARS